jgi:hypothetical protein
MVSYRQASTILFSLKAGTHVVSHGLLVCCQLDLSQALDLSSYTKHTVE